MSESPNKFIRFWQELKRREVFGVVTTYAATAYIIIEVTNNLSIPLHLPDWFASFELIVLIIGLPIVVILSWIFDFTPKGIERTESLKESESKVIIIKPVKRKLRASYVLNAILIIAVIVLAYPKIFKRNSLENLRAKGKISVAVMPFQNMTNDTIWNVWQDGIQDMLITSLSNSEELKVRQRESVTSIFQGKGLTNFTSITPSVASNISKKLNANVFIFGSIKQAGSMIRVNAQLIDTETKEVFKSFQIEGLSDVKNLFQIIDSISAQIRNYLVISKLINENRDTKYSVSTTSPEAYKYYVLGDKARINSDYSLATTNLLEAIRVDSNFVLAYVELCGTYVDQGMYEQAKKWSLILHNRRDLMPSQYKTIIDLNYAVLFETPNEAIKLQKLMIDIDDQAPVWYSNLGYFYLQLNQYDKSIPELEKALGIFEKWDSKPTWVFNYTMLGTAYHKTNQFKKEKELYKEAEQDFPNDPELIKRQAILSFTEKDTIKANRYVKKYISILKDNSSSDATISTDLAVIYYESGNLTKAEEYKRKALLLEPDSTQRIDNLAYFLIDKDRNIPEGMELVDKALKLSPDSYFMLDTKGWGLYKQGNYKEALETLQKSWDLRRQLAVYDHEAFLHLEAAKKAVAGMKIN